MTRSQQSPFSEKGCDVLPPTPPARPESAWVPLLCTLPLGLSPPNPRRGERSGPRHRWLQGPAPSPPGRQAAFPQPGLLKPNPTFQLQHERAPGPAFPGDPTACRSHGQGIFPVQCSKPAEPPAQRAGRDSNRLPASPTSFSQSRQGRPRGQRWFFLGRLLPWEAIPGGVLAQISLEQFPFLPAIPPPAPETHLLWPRHPNSHTWQVTCVIVRPAQKRPPTIQTEGDYS